jgi:flagellar protein FlaG
MGASGGATELIFFVSAVIVATAVVAVAANGIYELTDGISDRGEQVNDEMSTHIVIINDASAMPNDPLLIYVQNIGSTTLNHNYISVMLDGEVITDRTLSLSGNRTSFWDPASLLTISIDMALASGDHTVQVITENGVSDSLSFRI